MKLFTLLTGSSAPFLLFLGKVNALDSDKNIKNFQKINEIQEEKLPKPTVAKNILLVKRGWTVSFNQEKCQLIKRVEEDKTTVFTVKCEEYKNSLLALVNIFDKQKVVEFWLELNGSQRAYFHNSHIRSLERAKHLLPQHCLFISSSDTGARCILSWDHLFHLNKLAGRENTT